MFKKKFHGYESEVKQVKCETCKHYIDKKDAHIVINRSRGWELCKSYYCPMHKVDYDMIDLVVIYDKNYHNNGKYTEKICYFKLIPAVADHYEEIKKK